MKQLITTSMNGRWPAGVLQLRFGHRLGIAGLFAVTLLAFSPLAENDFVNYDDPFTLQRNEHLAAPAVLRWAFTTNHMGHYQPFSWLAWSSVKTMFGLSPAAFHALSLLGHFVCAILIYLVAIRLSARAGSDRKGQHLAALVSATAFAVHPMRVEVVAWASAFPYILASAWLLVAFLAYASYCSSATAIGRRGWFGLSICCYVFSLLSRAVAIGFPFLLLALDLYPLRRAQLSVRRKPFLVPGAVLLEKMPFLAAAIIAGVVESQSRALTGIEEVGPGARLTMAVTAPFAYLARTLVPIGGSTIDARAIQPQIEWVPLLLGLVGFVAISTAVWRAWPRWPALAVAWASLLFLLAPAIGLTPSGQQVVADRYMYIPGVVVSLLAGGIVATFAPVRGRAPDQRILRRVATVAVLAFLGLSATATWRQTRWWHDSITLWTHAADRDPRNDIATYNLAIALADAGREREAAERYQQTLRLVPDHAPARHNLTLIQARQAEREGDQLAAAGRVDEAIAWYSRVLELDATRNHARASRGMALLRRGRFAEAADDLRASLDARSNDKALINALAFALFQNHRSGEAASVLKQALAHYPDDDELAHNLARVLATSPDASVRDGDLALRLAIAVRDRSGTRDPRVLDTLAAAYAATGLMPRARTTAAEAVALATELGDRDMAADISTRARAYGR